MVGSTAAERRELLQQNFIFSRLTDEESAAVLKFARAAHYRAGAAIFAKGDPGESMMLVLKGRVRLGSLSVEGKEAVFNIVQAGQIFGEIALLDGKERTADAIALTDCEILVVERRDFMPILARHAELCMQLLLILCERLRRTSEQVEDVLFRHLESRIAKNLLTLARDHGNKSQDQLRISFKLSQRELGNFVGATRESINKHLQVWQRAGIIALEGGYIVIRNPVALEALT
jgi:CRP/FNR family cyclic AMP-dependent transcriptional regulator